MVVQEDDAPMEPLSKRTKKYVLVKNHVRELLPESESAVLLASDSKDVEKPRTLNKESLKRKKRLSTELPSVSQTTNISKSDLDELKTVYRNCKAVLRKIESKYGHLLNLEDESAASYKNTASDESSGDGCSCFQKKKIVFDENGQQIEKDCHLENHICVKRIKKSQSEIQPQKPGVEIEYDNVDTILPDNLEELENILKDDNIDHSYRRMVINKILLIRQEYLNEMKYKKEDIIKQLKANPNKLLDFKGTNLSSLQGYPTKPVESMKE